jgi:hypothetical protein
MGCLFTISLNRTLSQIGVHVCLRLYEEWLSLEFIDILAGYGSCPFTIYGNSNISFRSFSLILGSKKA